MASNSSAAMTPRIMMEKEMKQLMTPPKVKKEINFTESMLQTRLSPEQIDIVNQLKSSRKKEIEENKHYEYNNGKLEELENDINSQTVDFRRDSPIFMATSEAHEFLQSSQKQNLHPLQQENAVVFDSPAALREKRRNEILESLKISINCSK